MSFKNIIKDEGRLVMAIREAIRDEVAIAVAAGIKVAMDQTNVSGSDQVAKTVGWGGNTGLTSDADTFL